jgi:cobaltochelatase CobS
MATNLLEYKHSQRTLRKGCKWCQSTDLYWAHDPDGRQDGRICEKGHAYGRNWTLVNRDGSPHRCRTDIGNPVSPSAAETAETDEEPAAVSAPAVPMPTFTPAVPAPAAQTTEPVNDSAIQALQAFMNAISPKVDANDVNKIIDERLAAIQPPNVNADQVADIVNARLASIGALPLQIEIKHGDGAVKPITGMSHKAMPLVLKKIMAGRKAGMPVHVYMHGPGGTGKTSIAPQIAEALNLPYYPISLGPTMTESKLMGYMLATGYVGTQWTKAVEFGGVVLLDECDSANSAVLTVADAALANGHIGLPDGRTIPVHKDFIVIAAGNTTGNGADRMYVGRQAQDKAFLDRFTFVDVGYDLVLEESMCLRTGLDAGRVRQVLAYVRDVRQRVLDARMPVLIGMRASIGACLELAGEVPWSEIIDGRIRHGMSDADWRKVSDGISRPRL